MEMLLIFFFSVFFTPFNLFGYIWLTPDPRVLNGNKAGINEGIERRGGIEYFTQAACTVLPL